jgi:hypothetical protein
MEELRALAGRSDPVPDEAIRFVESLFTWRTVDAELAELSYDSVLDDEGAALAQGPDQPRLLTFGGRSMTLEVEVVEVRGRRGLRGQLAPPQPAEIEARQRNGIQRARADEMGRFLIEGLAPGPVSLRCRAGSEREAVPTDTDWFLL